MSVKCVTLPKMLSVSPFAEFVADMRFGIQSHGGNAEVGIDPEKDVAIVFGHCGQFTKARTCASFWLARKDTEALPASAAATR